MRMALYLIILALLFLAPVKRLDVAKLEPVQTVAVDVDGGMVILETDTKNKGQGEDVVSAIADLEEKTPGVIYLDTAQYLLVTERAAAYVKELEKFLNPSVRVSLWDGQGSVENADRFLDVRNDLPKLKHWSKMRRNLI